MGTYKYMKIRSQQPNLPQLLECIWPNMGLLLLLFHHLPFHWNCSSSYKVLGGKQVIAAGQTCKVQFRKKWIYLNIIFWRSNSKTEKQIMTQGEVGGGGIIKTSSYWSFLVEHWSLALLVRHSFNVFCILVFYSLFCITILWSYGSLNIVIFSKGWDLSSLETGLSQGVLQATIAGQ